MVFQCRNCAGRLILDPAKQMLVCDRCGSEFKPEEFEVPDKDSLTDKKELPMNEVYGTVSAEFMDCYVYTCAGCGGEIIINGTEASTSCIYCGNPNVVFNRIAKQRQPDLIMPFRITKESAISLAREKIRKGAFVPRAIKNFDVDCYRGIYIPYWLVSCNYYDTTVIWGEVRQGLRKVIKFFGRSGQMEFKDIPVDASTVLSDDSSSKLEPFDLAHLKPFDEDYLAGFYSNVSDVTYKDVRKVTEERKNEFASIFHQEAEKTVDAARTVTVNSCPVLDVDSDMKYVMLPAWFITFDHKGKHHTILVNGDTGKVVCAVPWNKTLFYSVLTAIALAVAIASFPLFKMMLAEMYANVDNDAFGGGFKLMLIIIGVIITLFSTGIRRVRKVLDNIRLTQDKAMFNFTKKRQG